MEANYPPKFRYQEFGPQFTAEFFNASEWADLVAASGAQYYVLTSKHHDGFTNWPNERNFGWSSADVGPKRDIVGELEEAFRQRGDVRFGLYHSLYEWYHPLYLSDKNNSYNTRRFVEEKVIPDLVGLVNRYKPQVLWSDGDWEAEPEYWGSTDFLAWLYNESPVKDTVVTNDRWGRGVMCHHGGYYTCSDRYNPGVLQKHKWENAMTVDRSSWGHRRNMKLSDVLTMRELTRTLAMTVSCGGNLLMNVGPRKEGTIEPIFEERLRQMGKWLEVNGESIYGSVPWSHQNDTLTNSVWYTGRMDQDQGTIVYGILIDWPISGRLLLGAPQPGEDTEVEILGYIGNVKWRVETYSKMEAVIIDLPDKSKIETDWAWVMKFKHLKNGGNDIWK